MRSTIRAAPGKKFCGGDFSNIEGRFNAWLANEYWKLEAFVAYDEGQGPDLYKLAYARSFGVDVETVGKGHPRQMGKVQELALGYQGGIGAFLTMGSTYGLNVFELTKPVRDVTSAPQWDATALRYHKKGARKLGLYEAEWTAVQILVDNWRAANPAIVQSWWNYQDAAIEAVSMPGVIVHPAHTTRVAYFCDGRCLWCVLPSGRLLCYASPRVESEQVEYEDKDGELRTRTRYKVVFWGVDSLTKQWREGTLYGGLQCENIVQAGSRDVMVDAMFNAEAAGYELVLTVHDELLAEVDAWRDDLNAKHFEMVMAQKSPVYDGLPVAVSAWEDVRYVK